MQLISPATILPRLIIALEKCELLNHSYNVRIFIGLMRSGDQFLFDQFIVY